VCLYIYIYYILFKSIPIDAFITTTIITVGNGFVRSFLFRAVRHFSNGVLFSAHIIIIMCFFSTVSYPKVTRCLFDACARDFPKRFCVQTSKNYIMAYIFFVFVTNNTHARTHARTCTRAHTRL